MKLTRTLKISEKEFYDFLEKDLIDSVLRSEKREITPKDIQKGLTYTQTKKNVPNGIKVELVDYERGKIFSSTVVSIADTLHLTYKTKPTGDGLEITFIQEIESFVSHKMNKFFYGFSKAIYLGRMNERLFSIQTQIEKQREK